MPIVFSMYGDNAKLVKLPIMLLISARKANISVIFVVIILASKKVSQKSVLMARFSARSRRVISQLSLKKVKSTLKSTSKMYSMSFVSTVLKKMKIPQNTYGKSSQI